MKAVVHVPSPPDVKHNLYWEIAMVESHIDLARAAIESSFLVRQGSYGGTAAFRRNMDQSRRAIAASRDLLKRLRQRTIDETVKEAEWHRISAFDADLCAMPFRIWFWKRICPSVNGATWLGPWFTSSPGASRLKLPWWIGS